MEEQPVSNKSKKPITLNFDEFDLDSFELKPINKGLGFHDNDKKEKIVSRNLKASSSSFRQAPSSVPSLTGNKFLQNTPQTMANSGLMSGVEAIYGTKKEPLPKLVQKDSVKTKLSEASYLNQAVAFLIDFMIVAMTTTMLLSSFYFLGFESLDVAGFQEFVIESSIFALLFFSLCFLSYFSLLEPVGTIGKRCLSLRVCASKSRKPVTIRQSFVRSLVTLMSLVLAGIPLILDFQGKLSDSRVVEQ